MSARKSQPNDQSKRVWQRMLSGRRLDLLEPSPLDVEIEDIAHGLARVARWNGQTIGEFSFSVAQHSLLVLDIHLRNSPKLTNNEQLISLLHDAPEYVIGDMISPLKAVVGGDYKTVEQLLLDAILTRFSLPLKTSVSLKKSIKKADMIAAYYEAVLLAGFSEVEALKYFGRPQSISPDGLPLVPWPAKIAEKNFLKRFHSLIANTGS